MKKYIVTLGLVTLLLVCGMNAVYAGQGQQHQQYPPVSASPNPVLEGERFTVTVRDADGNPIPNICVVFNGKTNDTDSKGQCWFDAPNNLDVDTWFIVSTQDHGSANLLVRAKVLHMNTITVSEGASFKEYVYDQDGKPVSGAIVIFMGTPKVTGSDGYTYLSYTAPWVYQDEQISVQAYKSPYTSAESSVYVINNDAPQSVQISGIVSDDNTGNKLVGATVVSNTDGQEQATTDSNGHYIMYVQLSHSGQDIKLTASYSGYWPKIKTVSNLQGGEQITQNFNLVKI